MNDNNEADNALATHMMLDPKVQERVIEILTGALGYGWVEGYDSNGQKVIDREPVNNLIRALFMNHYFKTSLLDALRAVDHHEKARYDSGYHPPKGFNV